ncbi:MAG TPA: 4-hydroxythreonine-4-phosphate dehydrogenase PdxA [Oligoflexia bacterium]|nr:4-hydroxythreonine-4-phosphate dehydrogenase PdxA [Oligoflexia bacterium]HMR25628.1 4-hydroxythreonine-4-phosphate dehydrogenase PdxA [Oligoflexia bacterium]
MSKTIGITLGDIWGIGPEIIVKSLLDLQTRDSHTIKIFSDQKSFAALAKEQNLLSDYDKLINNHKIQWEPLAVDAYTRPENKLQRASIAKASLDAAIEQAMQQELQGIVTAPLDKKIMQEVIENFVGHTEYLQEKTKVKQTWMMLSNDELNIVLLSNHLLLKEVSGSISQEKIMVAVKDMVSHFKNLGKSSIKIAVCALNPHCGELSENSEEKTIIKPTIDKLNKQGFEVEGPFSADALFYQARKNQRWTAILAMYHDQGLVAAKYSGTDQAINITLGLPFIRVSPAHGVAYDLVGKNMAQHQSMFKALQYILAGSKKSRSDI